MAKAKPNLAGVLDNLPVDPSKPPTAERRTRERGGEADGETTVLVGANLPPRYARNLAMLHAETGKTKKELIQEALDLLFVSKGGSSLRL